ncbi:MAG: UDP-2,3-diacylglucosamine diphosphatase [Fidelibacterota bacterium]
MNLPLFFISDIHLRLTISDEEKEKRAQLIRFIDHVVEQQGTLFIVGDLFDFWFEYKYVMPKAFFDVQTALYRAKSNGVEIFFVPGNHDYWVKDFVQETIFTQVFPKGTNLEISEKKFLVVHGDGILSWDRGYRLLRRIIRNRWFVFLFRLLHPDLGFVVARTISRSGRHPTHTDEYNRAVITELMDYAHDECEEGVDFVIMGHYHQLKQVHLENGTLVVLGDWLEHRSFGLFDGKEFSLNYWR